MIVGFIGAGHIAHALAEGWSRSGLPDPPELLFFDVDAGRAAALAAACGGATAADAGALVAALRPRAGLRAPAARGRGPVRHRPRRSADSRSSPSPPASRSTRCWRRSPAGSRAARVMPNVAAALGLGTFLFVPGTLGERPRARRAALRARRRGRRARRAALRRGHVGRRLHARHARAARRGRGRRRRGARPRPRTSPDAWPSPACTERPPSSPARAIPAAVVTATATPGGMTAAAIEALEERDLAAAVHAAVAAATARAKELA